MDSSYVPKIHPRTGRPIIPNIHPCTGRPIIPNIHPCTGRPIIPNRDPCECGPINPNARPFTLHCPSIIPNYNIQIPVKRSTCPEFEPSQKYENSIPQTYECKSSSKPYRTFCKQVYNYDDDKNTESNFNTNKQEKINKPDDTYNKPRSDNNLDLSTKDDNKSCVICLDNPPEYAIKKCGHLCLCTGCSLTIEKCPICRIDVDVNNDLLKIFVC